MTKHFDVAIIGSGFSGSILAWILASRGRHVALIDAAQHPRFAIGESSTPIADFLLKSMGKRYGIPELVELSAYGSWQQHHSQLACGRKRGFSYYVHESGKEFTDSSAHENSLMVAASKQDDLADTHWYRRDVDQFFFQQAVSAGASDFTNNSVLAISTGEPQQLQLSRHGDLTADWIVDASGRAGVTARLLQQPSLAHQLKTHTKSTYAHYRNVRPWKEILAERGLLLGDDPFDTDDAAQHHLLGDRWMWMLRFNNGITSVGWTAAGSVDLAQVGKFPSIDLMLAEAELVEPVSGPIVTDRLQRLFDPVVGPRCVMLPSTACTIDPLHSTGIAHALGGVERIAKLVLDEADQVAMMIYGQAVLDEARFLDRLVSTAYRTMNNFSRFTAACMLYFTAAIACEERLLQDAQPSRLWNADDARIVNIINECCSQLLGSQSSPHSSKYVRDAIGPWNTAGLMNPHANNRYAYTATKS